MQYLRLSKALVILVVILLPCIANSQAKVIKQADEFYFQKRYKEAYGLYSKAYEKKKDKAVLLKMADCNYFVENFPVAQKYYADYFNGTQFQSLAQYAYYANASRLSGKLELAYQLYTNISKNGGDESSKTFVESCRLYLDSANKIRVYNIDSTYTCVEIDATDSHDALAAPMTYVWDFKDGTFGEGIKVSHCFQKTGLNRISLSIRDKTYGYMRVNDTVLSVFIDAPPVQFTCNKRPRQYIYTNYDATKLSIDNFDILEYIWDLGDGEVSLGKKVSYKFDKLGYYTIKLTVVAKNNSTGTKTLFASCRVIEVVDNYDRSQDPLKGGR
jgi:hypothetical protein